MSVVYVPYKEIDKNKWDACIINSPNGLLYSSSIFLDTMAGQWDALVLEDYIAVMPLPFRNKFGILYIYPPAFTQQLGVSSTQTTDTAMVEAFLAAIPGKFRYIEMNLNAGNNFNYGNFTKRKNYLLDISNCYTELKKNYSRSARRNIVKATKNQVSIIENPPAASIIALHRFRYKDNIGFGKQVYDKLFLLAGHFIKQGQCYTVAAKNHAGQLVAGSIYFIYKNSITFIFNGNSAEGLETGATHLLMDHTIKTFSNQNYKVDFEGSDNPSFARFYEQYGAVEENYIFVRINRLPWPIHLLKNNLFSQIR